MLVFGLPRVGEVAFDGGVGGLPILIVAAGDGGFVRIFGAVPGLSPACIGEADGVIEDGALGHIGIGGGEAGGEHASHGVADDHGFRDTERLKQGAGVERHVVEVIRDDGLRGAAETDLIGHDDAEAGVAEGVDGAAEVEAAEIHAMEEDCGAAVGLTGGRDVHVGHADILPVDGERQVGDRVGIGDVFVGDAAGLDVSGCGAGLLGQQDGGGAEEQQYEATHGSSLWL